MYVRIYLMSEVTRLYPNVSFTRPARPADVISREMIETIAESKLPNSFQNVVVYTTIHEYLGMSKVYVRRVTSRNLSMQHRQRMGGVKSRTSDVYNANPEDVHTRLVT